MLAIAASLASTEHPVDLNDAVTGIDRETLRCVLRALAHASGIAGAIEGPRWACDERR